MRDSPPELERLLPGPKASISVTRRPAVCSACAVQVPKTPAPITATSAPGRVVFCVFASEPIGANAAAAMSFVAILRVVLMVDIMCWMGCNANRMLRLDNVSRSYGMGHSVLALRGVNLELAPRERVAIMGPSGSGKSTLLNLACGLDVPTTGKVLVGGVELSSLSDDERTRLRREKIGMVFQTFNLLPTLTAVENVALPLRLQSLSRKDAERRAVSMLGRVGLQQRTAHRPDELSGGERQRVAIARALIFEPLLLLADEPTGNLDSATGEEILRLLDSLQQECKSTLLMVTHNAVAASYCHRIVKLSDGQISQDRHEGPDLRGGG
jgi:putative ABC transport system ATP-binding protein